LLSVQGLSFEFGRQKVLHDISFEADAGLHVVVGDNGSGKTTLLRIVATALKAPQGTVFVDGTDLYQRRSRKNIRKRLSFLPQTTRPDSRLTVRDWLEFGAWLQNLQGCERQALISAVLETWHLHDLMSTRMKKLSVGQRRRVDLARACLKTDLKVLVLDEPFAALDSAAADICRKVLEHLSTRTVVLFSDPHTLWDRAQIAVDLSRQRHAT
jgi:ABC-2 type transport system ATP-binding protein